MTFDESRPTNVIKVLLSVSDCAKSKERSWLQNFTAHDKSVITALWTLRHWSYWSVIYNSEQ